MIDERALVSCAQAWLQPWLGEEPGGRFFLAGGAFKSLLHGRPPRDLDLWPPTELDRRWLTAQLVRSGATLHLENPPYQTSYLHAGRLIELAHDSSATTLEARLGRFDLGLSAIGVEYRQGSWRGAIHPLAHESLRRCEILLLKPLVNWKYALATLERMLRYSSELGFRIPRSEEQTIWDVFDQQPAEEQQSMVARYLRVCTGDERILHEARRRSRRG